MSSARLSLPTDQSDIPQDGCEALVRGLLDAAQVRTGLIEIVDAYAPAKPDIRHLAGNAAAARFNGLTPDSLKGRTARDLGLSEDVIQDWVRHCRECERRGGRIRFGYDVSLPRGLRRMSATLAPMPAPSGITTRFAYIIDDVTAFRLPADAVERDTLIHYPDYCHDVLSSAGSYPLRQTTGGFLPDLVAGRTVRVEDARSGPRTAGSYAKVYSPLQAGAFLAVPLLKEGRLIGILSVHAAHHPRTWQARESALVERVLEHTSLFLENARWDRAARLEVEERRRAEVRVRELSEHLRVALEAAQMVSFTWDTRNDRVHHLAGRPEMGTFTHVERLSEAAALVHPDDRPIFEAGIQEALSTGYFESVFRVLNTRGDWIWCLSKGRVTMGGDGRPDRLSGIMLGISERKAAEDQLRDLSQRLRFCGENSPLAVFEFSADFHLTRWSKGAERVFGWMADEALGRHISDLPWVHPDDVVGVRGISHAMENGVSMRNVNPKRNVRKDGQVIHCEWYNSALYDESGNLDSILSLVLDVTDREEADRERDLLLSALETERARLVEALDDLAESRELYRILGEAIPYGVWRMAYDAPGGRSPWICRRRESRSLPIRRIEQAFVTVLGNAVKYKPAEWHIGVDLRDNGEEAIVTVRDDGPGISVDVMPRIFGLFAQGDRLHREGRAGLGIGLALSRHLVEMHGGDIMAASPGPGAVTTFTIRLPLAEQPAA